MVWHNEARWHLREPETLDGARPFTWAFTRCVPFEPRVALRARSRSEGTPVDFTLADFDIPILSPKAVDVLAPLVGEFCEFIPVDVEGQEQRYSILNIFPEEDCAHEQASDLLLWRRGDGRDDLIGGYRQVTRLVIRRGLQLPPIFRLSKFHIRILVDQRVAAYFGPDGLTGVIPKRIEEAG